MRISTTCRRPTATPFTMPSERSRSPFATPTSAKAFPPGSTTSRPATRMRGTTTFTFSAVPGRQPLQHQPSRRSSERGRAPTLRTSSAHVPHVRTPSAGAEAPVAGRVGETIDGSVRPWTGATARRSRELEQRLLLAIEPDTRPWPRGLMVRLVRPQLDKDKGKEVTHSLPHPSYNAQVGLRQAPGRAGESPIDARNCGDSRMRDVRARPCRRVGLEGMSNPPGLRGAAG